jgi:hypothetical protein
MLGAVGDKARESSRKHVHVQSFLSRKDEFFDLQTLCSVLPRQGYAKRDVIQT